jgi:hypothetical protein
MVRKFGAALVAFAALGVVAVVGDPASASCVGPRVSYDPAEVARGEMVTITGAFWGDACNDGGPLGRKDVLGVPIQKITISLLQGDRRIVVARGAADDNYEFVVKVRIPSSLQPGGANVIATEHRAPYLGGGTEDYMTDQLRITDAPPTHASRKVKVVKFGR